LLLCGVYYVVMAFIAPGFFSVNNFWNILFNLLPLLVAAIGQTFVMVSGGIDLSITSTIALSSVSGAYIMTLDGIPNPYLQIAAGVVVMVIIGICIGIVNGLSVTRFNMPPFMVTLTTMMLFSGIAIWSTQSQNIYNLPEPLLNFTYHKWVGIPLPVILCIVFCIITILILNNTLTGRWIYAVGSNIKAARISGVNVHQTIIAAYIIGGICGALSSVLYTARLETGSPVMGQRVLLDIIGAVVIGGTSLFGGKGKIQWTIAGVLFIVLLDNSLNLLGLSYFVIMIFKGIVILLAAILNVMREKSLNTA